jgi:hypothetical protein
LPESPDSSPLLHPFLLPFPPAGAWILSNSLRSKPERVAQPTPRPMGWKYDWHPVLINHPKCIVLAASQRHFEISSQGKPSLPFWSSVFYPPLSLTLSGMGKQEAWKNCSSFNLWLLHSNFPCLALIVAPSLPWCWG